MSGTRPDTISCPQLQQGMQQAFKKMRALTAAEATHVENCKECFKAWLDESVTQALDTKPEVEIPDGFAARVAEKLPAKRSVTRRAGKAARQWGLLTAVLLVCVGMLAIAFINPIGVHSRMGMVFMALVVSEIAGIALWLGTGRAGNSRG